MTTLHNAVAAIGRRLRPRRRALASINAEARDGIMPAALGLAETTDQHDTAPAAAPGYRLIALIVACGLFMEALDATVLATALPTMARDLGVRAPELSVALTAYLLALAVFIPASGAMADRFGSRTVFRAAMALFLAGSIACGLAPGLGALIAARFVQGAGGAMMIPVGRLVLLRSVAKRDLVSATSWLIMPALIGPILGPPVGGAIVTLLDWRWIFWINLPIGIVGLVLATLYLPDVREPADDRFDVPGFVVSGVALGCLLFGFELFSRPGDARAAAALVAIGVVAAIAYLRHARRRPHPILDLSLMRVPTFRLSVIAGSLTRITQGAQVFLLPLMMQLGFGYSAGKSGLLTVATTIGSFGMKAVARRILHRFGFRASLSAVGVLATFGYLACGLMRPSWPVPALYAVMIAAGFLMSFQFTAYNTIAYDEIDKHRMSRATSFYATFQQLTLSLGICLAAAALHVGTALHHRATPTPSDFTAAFGVVTAVSILALFVNLRFAPDAGDELAGRKPA